MNIAGTILLLIVKISSIYRTYLKNKMKQKDTKATNQSLNELRNKVIPAGNASGISVSNVGHCHTRVVEAKAYVADRLGASVTDLTDPVLMSEAREDLKLDILHPRGGSPKCMEAKFNIVRLLDMDINCVRRFRENASL